MVGVKLAVAPKREGTLSIALDVFEGFSAPRARAEKKPPSEERLREGPLDDGRLGDLGALLGSYFERAKTGEAPAEFFKRQGIACAE